MDASASCKDTADAMKFCRDYKVLHEKLNPRWSQSAAQNVFPASAATSEWLGEFDLYEEIYATVEPDTDSYTPAMRQVIKRELGRDVNVLVQLHMAIPKDLVKTCSPTPIRIAIRFHGGGGVTGHPMFGPWVCRADLEWILSSPSTISIEPTYCLMPEATGDTIYGNIRSLCAFLFKDLKAALKSINPHFAIAWDRVYIFGISFGAVVLRCPLVKEYRREPGHYMGVEIPKEQAVNDSKRIYEIKHRMPFQLHRAGDHPPRGMYGAYALSVAQDWGTFWETSTIFDMIKETQKCPDLRAKIRINYGTADIQVPYTSSEELCALFKEKGWQKIHLILHKDKPHAWDYSEPLSESLSTYLEASSV
ncbi:unnamed protein product [Alternaria alternata]